MHIKLATIQNQEADYHKMQWPPDILLLIRYMVREDIQRTLGARIKASAWRAVHKELLSKAPGLYVHGRAKFGPVEFDYKKSSAWLYGLSPGLLSLQALTTDQRPEDICTGWFNDRDLKLPIFSGKHVHNPFQDLA